MKQPEPVPPKNLHPLTQKIFDEISAHPWADQLVIGGGVALSYYLEYRATVDADVWWSSEKTSVEKNAILKEIRMILEEIARKEIPNASIELRKWRDTDSLEMKLGGKKTYSFQVARRDIQIKPYQPAPKTNLLIETLEDNLAQKMCALVNRGSPRDFLDIYTVIQNKFASQEELWALWEKKNPELQIEAAKISLAKHLASLEARRPISSFPDDKRRPAAALREFFRQNLPTLHHPNK